VTWLDDIARLAARHWINNLDELREAISSAQVVYDSVQSWPELEAPDALDRIDAPALAMFEALDDRRYLDRVRLVQTLTAGSPSGTAVEEMLDKLDDWLVFLDEIRLAARKAHKARGRGSPARKPDLRAAYCELVQYWLRSFGEAKFTQGWADTTEGLKPTSPAAAFLYDAMTLIDHHRPRLAEELRALMMATVAELPGSRRGRRT
jgi:hypothetical protein